MSCNFKNFLKKFSKHILKYFTAYLKQLHFQNFFIILYYFLNNKKFKNI